MSMSGSVAIVVHLTSCIIYMSVPYHVLPFLLSRNCILQVCCKVINVRSGDELPEKCRELSMHFETQGTPVMIGMCFCLKGLIFNVFDLIYYTMLRWLQLILWILSDIELANPGGGVLAYTLLGVDYNEASGDCAFLILDPHYTGTDDLKKIVNGGWCGWKKSVDNKGRSFFLKDKFYNLLLPQRPDMVWNPHTCLWLW